MIMANNTLIMGDSYSTFEGYIPEGYAVYYSEAGRPETDVTKVTETWWSQVVEEAGLNLVLNNSWSGSTIGYTGWEMKDNSKTSSFIYRLQKLKDEGFFEKNKVDLLFIFGGTNDSWADSPLGEQQFDDYKREDLYCVLPAIGYFLSTARKNLKDAEIVFVLNDGLKPEIGEFAKIACEKNGVTFVELENVEKENRHPTVLGMTAIKEQIKAKIKGVKK